MQAVAFVLATFIVLPYAALTAVVLFVGHALLRGSWRAFFEAIGTGLDLLVPWGLLGIVGCVLALLVLGVRRDTRSMAAVVLTVLALASALVVAWAIQPSGGFGISEIALLLPCLLAAAVGVWLKSAPQP